MAVSILSFPKHPSKSPTRAARTSVGLWKGVPKVVDAVRFEFYAQDCGFRLSWVIFEQKFVPDFWGKLSDEIVRSGIPKITVHTVVKAVFSMLKIHLGLSVSRDSSPERQAVFQK